MDREEEKVPSFASRPLATNLGQYQREDQVIASRLHGIFVGLGQLYSNIGSEYTKCKRIIDEDPEFCKYLNSLHGCTTSLQHLVNDIAHIHMSVRPPSIVPPFNPYYPRMVRPPYPSRPWYT